MALDNFITSGVLLVTLREALEAVNESKKVFVRCKDHFSMTKLNCVQRDLREVIERLERLDKDLSKGFVDG